MRRDKVVAISITVLLGSGCAARAPIGERLPPGVIPHSAWEATPAVGQPADGTRRNLKPGDRLVFKDLMIEVGAVVPTTRDSTTKPATTDVVQLRLTRANERAERVVAEGAAFNWSGYHVVVVAIPNPGELGAGLVSLEVATVSSLPAHVASSDSAGGAAMRLRVPHEITHITLHHTGDAQPLRPEDDPALKLRNLQSWGARDRNWWDVPYHFLLDLNGTVREGRDYHYMGETNTTYDPRGHFLISMIGNYEKQEPTQAQLEAIADLMAWAVKQFNVPLDRIGGHYNYAETTCPGPYLRKYLEDGTFRRMVEERLRR
jgi:hypothetical protein